jgi:glyoxylase-like metal-dependent hydrolase (beta-lactamase superfamily II)
MAEIVAQRAGLFLVRADLDDFSVRGAVVAGKARAVVWDTLAHPENMKGIAELIPRIPFDVVYSHGDWDHVLGTSGLSRPPEEIIAQEQCRHRLRQELPEALTELAREGKPEYRTLSLLPPTRTFETKLDLDLGEVTMELRHLEGHTSDTVVAFIPQWNVLLAGDAVETPLPFLNPSSPIKTWIDGLNDWADRMDSEPEPATVIPSHGTVGGTELLREAASYLEEIEAGRDPMKDQDLSPFYRETHAFNRILAGADARNPSRPPG